MAETPKRPLQVFLCHASADKPTVRVLYKRLVADGVDAWLDEVKLMPGQYWRDEISVAVQRADAVIVCLSNNSITKEGFVQKEIRFALDFAEEKPEGTIYLIPARLEDCEVPRRLQYWQWVDLFFDGKTFNETGYQNLLRSLKVRASKSGTLLPASNVLQNRGEYKKQSEANVKSLQKSTPKSKSRSLNPTPVSLTNSSIDKPSIDKEKEISAPAPSSVFRKFISSFKNLINLLKNNTFANHEVGISSKAG